MKPATIVVGLLLATNMCLGNEFFIDTVAGDGEPTNVGQPFGVEIEWRGDKSPPDQSEKE